MLWVQEVWTKVGENITGAQPLPTAGERRENNCVCCDSGGEPRSGIPHAGRCAGSGHQEGKSRCGRPNVGSGGKEKGSKVTKSPQKDGIQIPYSSFQRHKAK